MDHLDLGARHLNGISYTSFQFLPTNPYDWFNNLRARISKYCRCIESREAEPDRGWITLSDNTLCFFFFLSTYVSPAFTYSSSD